MPSFKHRSYQKELLDRDDIPFDDIKRNMQELDFINRGLGGHAITLSGFRKMAEQSHGLIQVVEIGCGGGDNLRVIEKWAWQHGLKVELKGIDINPECIT